MKDYQHIMIPLDSIILDLENPRYEQQKTQADAISILIKHEKIFQLAKDIVNNGMSNLNNVGLIPQGTAGYYIVVDANRRVCALKLLSNPSLAPTTHRDAFKNLAKNWTPIQNIRSYVYKDREDSRCDVFNAHAGEQGGVGKVSWSTVQKERALGSYSLSRPTGNRQAYLYTEKLYSAGIIKPKMFNRKLTTIQRLLNTPRLRKALGVTFLPDKEIEIDIDSIKTKIAAKKLADDIDVKPINGKTTWSRFDKNDSIKYAQEIENPIDTESCASETSPTESKNPKKPSKPTRPTKVTYVSEIDDLLNERSLAKQAELYYSICTVSAEKHLPLVLVGSAVFLETLAKKCEMKEKGNLVSFLRSKLQGDPIIEGKNGKELLNIVSGILSQSNIVKHSKDGQIVNHLQWVHNFDRISPLIKKFIEVAIVRK